MWIFFRFPKVDDLDDGGSLWGWAFGAKMMLLRSVFTVQSGAVCIAQEDQLIFSGKKQEKMMNKKPWAC